MTRRRLKFCGWDSPILPDTSTARNPAILAPRGMSASDPERTNECHLHCNMAPPS